MVIRCPAPIVVSKIFEITYIKVAAQSELEGLS
jgi:hypothetical protein